MKAFLIELCNRLTIAEKSEETMQVAKAMGWLTTAKLIAEATELRKTINAENLYRFQSIYGLCKDHQTSWVQLAIDVSLRDRGEQVWTCRDGSDQLRFIPWAVASAESEEGSHTRRRRFDGRHRPLRTCSLAHVPNTSD